MDNNNNNNYNNDNDNNHNQEGELLMAGKEPIVNPPSLILLLSRSKAQRLHQHNLQQFRQRIVNSSHQPFFQSEFTHLIEEVDPNRRMTRADALSNMIRHYIREIEGFEEAANAIVYLAPLPWNVDGAAVTAVETSSDSPPSSLSSQTRHGIVNGDLSDDGVPLMNGYHLPFLAEPNREGADGQNNDEEGSNNAEQADEGSRNQDQSDEQGSWEAQDVFLLPCCVPMYVRLFGNGRRADLRDRTSWPARERMERVL